MLQEILYHEEQRLFNEISRQKGFNLRKLGKLLQLNALTRRLGR
jgi:hypothetical protein